MTRLPPASRALVRRALDVLATKPHHGYALELDAAGVRIRPLRSRDPAAEVYVSWTVIYQRALMARVPPVPRRRRRRP